MARSGYYGRCVNHPERKTTNAKMCDECFQKQNEYLKTRLRDVETYDEDRLLFLVRKSEEFGLGYTKKEINSMIRSGMTDSLILKADSANVWTYGSEASQALPFVYK